MIPDPRFGIDGFAYRPEQSQGGKIVGIGELVTGLDESPDGGRSSVEGGHSILLYDIPETAEVGIVGCALIHHLGHSIGQRAEDDVGVTGDPAYIGRAPVDVVVLHVEDVLAAGVGSHQVAAAGVENPFWFSGGSGGIENEERMFAVESLRSMGSGYLFGFLVPPHVPAAPHVHFLPGALVDDAALDALVLPEGLINTFLEFDDLAASVATIRGDHRGGPRVLKAVHDGFGRKATEHDGMHGSDAGTGQHGDSRLRHHGHVDQYAIPGLDAVCLQYVREAADLPVELLVGKNPLVARFSFPDDGSLVPAAVGQVAVHAVLTDVETGSGEPFRKGGLPLEDLLPALLPVQFPGLPRPEDGGLLDRLLVHPPVLCHAGNAGLLGEFLRGFEDSFFDEMAFNLLAHGLTGSSV